MSARGRFSNFAISALTVLLCFLIFFPILWMVLTSFKTEADAFVYPPVLFFQPVLDNWQNALQNSPYVEHLINTLLITFFCNGSSIVAGFPSGL